MTKWFKISTVAEALGINLHTARSWVAKGYVFPEEVKKAATAGGTTYLNEDGVRRLAVMLRLTAMAVSPERAFDATLQFFEVGEPTVSWSGEKPKTISGAEPRQPGELFPKGETFVICPAGDSRCYVHNWKRPAKGMVLLSDEFEAALILHLNPIMQKLDAKLADMPFEEDDE
jgi:hypothetical protein